MPSEFHASSDKAIPPLVTRPDDDPAVLADAAVDDYALHVVPPTWRMGRAKLAIAWSSTLAALFWVVLAAVAAAIVGTAQALIGMAIATAFFGMLGYVIQKVAVDTGVTLATFSRSLFGAIGVPIASLVFVVVAMTLAIFEGSVLAVAFESYFGGSIYLWYGVVAVLCTLITLGGVRVWLEKVNAWLLPIFLAGLVGALIWAIAEYGYQSDWISATAPDPTAYSGPGWLVAFALYLTGMVNVFYTFDFARLGRTKDEKYNGLVTFGWVYYVLAIPVIGGIGIYLSQAIPQDGVSEVGVVTGIVGLMGIWGVIYIFATQTKIQTANMYLSSLNLQIFFSRALRLSLPRSIWTLVAGVVLFGIMSANILTFVEEFLSYQGALSVAWVAVAVVHIAFRRKLPVHQRFEVRAGRVPPVNPGGLIAWVAGSAVGLVLVASDSPFSLTWALILTYVVSTVVYCVALLFAQPGWFAMARPFDPALEVADPWNTHVQCHRCDKSYVAVEMDRDPHSGHAAICAACATGRDFRTATRSDSNEATTKSTSTHI